jgi:hypothetical protein
MDDVVVPLPVLFATDPKGLLWSIPENVIAPAVK